jgi:hypothetical protein
MLYRLKIIYSINRLGDTRMDDTYNSIDLFIHELMTEEGYTLEEAIAIAKEQYKE